MQVISGVDICDLNYKVIKTIRDIGKLTFPRGFVCQELHPVMLRLLSPQLNILTDPIRNISQHFAAAELMWMLFGRDDVQMISFYNKNIAKYSDDGERFFGAYGPKLMFQLDYVRKTLVNDCWSRQAVVNIWREN